MTYPAIPVSSAKGKIASLCSELIGYLHLLVFFNQTEMISKINVYMIYIIQ